MLAAAGAVCGTECVLRAQAAFPNRPIRIVVPVAPGGGVDTFARLIAAKVKTQRDVQFIVENRTGGNSHDRRPRCPARRARRLHGAVPRLDAQCRAAGVEECALRSGCRFHADRAGRQAPLVHIVANNRPEKTLAEIVAAAKASPDRWSFATAQLGAPGHLAAVAFNQYNGLNLPIIVYRGTAPAANDVVGGHVPMMIEAILSLLPMVRAGSVRAIAVTSTKRSTLAPEIPTMAEVGLPALNFGAWWAMWGPPGMPADLDQDHQRLGQRRGEGAGRRGTSCRARHRAVGGDAAGLRASSSPTDIDRSAKLLKAANFQPE